MDVALVKKSASARHCLLTIMSSILTKHILRLSGSVGMVWAKFPSDMKIKPMLNVQGATVPMGPGENIDV